MKKVIITLLILVEVCLFAEPSRLSRFCSQLLLSISPRHIISEIKQSRREQKLIERKFKMRLSMKYFTGLLRQRAHLVVTNSNANSGSYSFNVSPLLNSSETLINTEIFTTDNGDSWEMVFNVYNRAELSKDIALKLERLLSYYEKKGDQYKYIELTSAGELSLSNTFKLRDLQIRIAQGAQHGLFYKIQVRSAKLRELVALHLKFINTQTLEEILGEQYLTTLPPALRANNFNSKEKKHSQSDLLSSGDPSNIIQGRRGQWGTGSESDRRGWGGGAGY